MVKVLVNDTSLSAIGDSIRTAKGEDKYLLLTITKEVVIDDIGNSLNPNYIYFDEITEEIAPHITSVKMIPSYEQGSYTNVGLYGGVGTIEFYKDGEKTGGSYAVNTYYENNKEYEASITN